MQGSIGAGDENLSASTAQTSLATSSSHTFPRQHRIFHQQLLQLQQKALLVNEAPKNETREL